MSIGPVQRFYAALSRDEAMQQKFAELSRRHADKTTDETRTTLWLEQTILSLAAQLGYSFTLGDLKAYCEEMQSAKYGRELSDDELAAVGGGGNNCDIAVKLFFTFVMDE